MFSKGLFPRGVKRSWCGNGLKVAQIAEFDLDRVGEKNCGKRRKCWLQIFSPFPTMFSKGFSPRFVKTWDCLVKGFSVPALCAYV